MHLYVTCSQANRDRVATVISRPGGQMIVLEVSTICAVCAPSLLFVYYVRIIALYCACRRSTTTLCAVRTMKCQSTPRIVQNMLAVVPMWSMEGGRKIATPCSLSLSLHSSSSSVASIFYCTHMELIVTL